MRFGTKEMRTSLAVSLLALVLLLALAPDSQAQQRLRITVGDTTGSAGELNSAVTVFFTNPLDEIFAFTLHLALTRNDIANFQTELDTLEEYTYWFCEAWDGDICTDSHAVDDPVTQPWNLEHVDTVEAFVGSFDITGSLIEGWDYVKSRAVSTGDLGLDMLITAISDTDSIPGYVPPLQPQQGGVLFRMMADIFPIPPEQEDRTAVIDIDVSYKRYFGFSTPAGESIGWVTVPVLDTNYYMCTNEGPPPESYCYEWTKVYPWECPTEGCDSVGIETVYIAELDTDAVRLFPGEITVLAGCCTSRVGDANGVGGDEPTIGDVSVMIDALFISSDWNVISCLAEADVNQSGGSAPIPDDISIGDVSVLIDYLFITGPALGLNSCM